MPQDVAVATTDQTPWNRLIDRAISDRDFPIANIESLWKMNLENDTRRQRREYNVAMAAAQAAMVPVLRSTTNSHLHTKYASYDAIDAVVRPIYSEQGFSVTFGTEAPHVPGNIRVVCVVKHIGGWEEKDLALEAPPDTSGSQGKANKTPVQAVGSTVSFLRRYLLCLAFNIVLANEDDDGEGQRKPPPDTRDRQAGKSPPSRPPGDATAGRDPLMVDYGPEWITNLGALLAGAATMGAVTSIRNHSRVVQVLVPTASTPDDVRAEIEQLFRAAQERLSPQVEGEPLSPRDKINQDVPLSPPGEGAGDPSDPAHEYDPKLVAMLDEVAAMDAITLTTLNASAPWRARVNDLFPLDQDILRDAIEERRIALKTQQGNAP
jgi:hypothetical protein